MFLWNSSWSIIVKACWLKKRLQPLRWWFLPGSALCLKRMPHKLAHPNQDKIIQAIRSGEKWEWIEVVYGCTSSTISRYRKKLGLKAPAPKLTQEDRERIVQLRKNHKLEQLAEMFGVDDGYISRLCIKANCARPHR